MYNRVVINKKGDKVMIKNIENLNYNDLSNDKDYFYHVSLSKGKDGYFSPRIPKNMAASENKDILRICVSTSIKNCLSAFPDANVLENLVMDNTSPGIPCLLYIYRIHKDLIPLENIIIPKNLKKSYGVLDAPITNEHWIVDTDVDFGEPYIIRLTEIEQELKSIKNFGDVIIIKRVDFEPALSLHERHYMYHFLKKKDMNKIKKFIQPIGEIVNEGKVKHSRFKYIRFLIYENQNISDLWELYQEIKTEYTFRLETMDYENIEDEYDYVDAA